MVAQELENRNGLKLSDGALRQRGRKALERLRKLYQEARSEIKVEWSDDIDTDFLLE